MKIFLLDKMILLFLSGNNEAFENRKTVGFLGITKSLIHPNIHGDCV
jgi:hypothetical protein